MVHEVVKEGVAGEEFEDIGGRSEETRVNLDDAVLGAVLGEYIGEVRGEEWELRGDIAEEIGFGVKGRVGEAVIAIGKGGVKEGGIGRKVSWSRSDEVGEQIGVLGEEE